MKIPPTEKKKKKTKGKYTKSKSKSNFYCLHLSEREPYCVCYAALFSQTIKSIVKKENKN